MASFDGSLTHLDEAGRAQMVDVTGKAPTDRDARARCRVAMAPETAKRLASGELGDADALAMARVAGIFAAKATPRLVPLCHAILLDGIELEVSVGPDHVEIEAAVHAHDRTGVEIEALSACLVAGLAVFDAVRSEDPSASIEDAVVLEKAGGRSGTWRRRTDGTVEHLAEPGSTKATAAPGAHLR